jgi:acyl-coenzyme A synthetase/AMP-(fatty) acid ligase
MFKMPDMSEWFNLGDYMLDRHIREGRGNKAAIYYRDQVITYSELQKAANKVGNALIQAGVEEENRVMICLPDTPEFLYTYFGAMRIGAIPVPISTMATPQDYKYFLNDGRGKVLVTNNEFAPNFAKVADELRYLRHFIVVGEAGAGQQNFNDFIKGASDSLEVAKTSKDDMAFWLYSSGTTGQPKGVVHMHHDILYLLPSYCENVLQITENDIIYSASKMYFSYGRNTMESVFMSGAAQLLVPDLPRPEVVVETISRYKPTIYFSIPTSYMGVLDLLDKMDQNGEKYDLTSLRRCISAGEALPKVYFDRWKEKFGVEILDGIGSTDVGGIYISSLPGKLVKSGSCGVLLPGFEVKLTDDDGNPVPDGEIGVLWMNKDRKSVV